MRTQSTRANPRASFPAYDLHCCSRDDPLQTAEGDVHFVLVSVELLLAAYITVRPETALLSCAPHHKRIHPYTRFSIIRIESFAVFTSKFVNPAALAHPFQ